jgi:predicted ribosome quality control (RQC) complex YloA/Tae2 family protein
MGWFSKKEEKKEKVPELPELPKLPELPNLKKEEPLHQLPSFPDSKIGAKFSQNAIKDAVTGKKEDEGLDANEFHEKRMMPEPIKKPSTIEASPLKTREKLSREIQEDENPEEIPEEFEEAASIVKKKEPVFIRLDRFEESMKIFENARTKIADIESMLKDVETIKQEEEKELENWKSEIQKIKTQIENIDKDIFSKV